MTHGPLFGKIFSFALPLIASGILQQSFNSVDVAVVGRFCSPQSLAAVGSNGMIIALIVNLFLGISIGANVVIARYIGQEYLGSVKKAVQTVMSLSVVVGVMLMFVGFFAAKPILEAISTPDDVLDKATLYLRLYFLGMPAMMVYNFGSAVLRSVGDTKRPFYCLVAGGVINVALNLLLVLEFKMDVAGVAIGTLVSSLISALLLLRVMTHEEEPLRLDINDFLVDKAELWKMLKIGVPAGIQGMVFPLSNTFIVSGINTFGAAGSAGSAAAINYEYYCYFLVASFASAAVAFTSQNYGAGFSRRCNEVFRHCLLMAVLFCGIANLTIAWQKDFFVGIFSSDPEVMEYGCLRIAVVLMFQWIASSYEIAGACMRGLGYSMTPTLITIFGTCAMRIAWIWFFHHTDYLTAYSELLMIYPITWILTGIAVTVAYYIVRRRAYTTLDGNTQE
ncbi:MAG: MATE family efflux transporter [Prevotella sp.]|nr:MATE family efflux transporter [Prevotella sp.]MCM1475577.1 MATE family efflux transporter [Muribaculaceae bacterium]